MISNYLNLEKSQIKSFFRSLLVVNYEEMSLLAFLLFPIIFGVIIAPLLIAEVTDFLPYFGYLVTIYIVVVFLMARENLSEFRLLRVSIHWLVILFFGNIAVIVIVYYFSGLWQNPALNIIKTIFEEMKGTLVVLVSLIGFVHLISHKLEKKLFIKLALLGVCINLLFETLQNTIFGNYYNFVSFWYQMQIPTLSQVIIAGAVAGVIYYYFFKRIESFIKIDHKEFYVFGVLSAFFVLFQIINGVLNYGISYDEIIFEQFFQERLYDVFGSLNLFAYGVGFYFFNKFTTKKQTIEQ